MRVEGVRPRSRFTPASLMVGISGAMAARLEWQNARILSLPGAVQRQQRAEGLEGPGDVAGHDVLHGRGATLVARMKHVHAADRAFEVFRREVNDAARSGRAVGILARDSSSSARPAPSSWPAATGWHRHTSGLTQTDEIAVKSLIGSYGGLTVCRGIDGVQSTKSPSEGCSRRAWRSFTSMAPIGTRRAALVFDDHGLAELLVSLSAVMRPTTSVAPPAGNGTTRRMVRSGNLASARATAGAAKRRETGRKQMTAFHVMTPCMLGCFVSSGASLNRPDHADDRSRRYAYRQPQLRQKYSELFSRSSVRRGATNPVEEPNERPPSACASGAVRSRASGQDGAVRPGQIGASTTGPAADLFSSDVAKCAQLIGARAFLNEGAVGHAGHIGLGRGSLTGRADFRDAQDIRHQQIRGGEAISSCQPFPLVQNFLELVEAVSHPVGKTVVLLAGYLSRNHQGTVIISIELSAAIIHCTVSAYSDRIAGASAFSLFRAKCSSPAPLSNISSSPSLRREPGRRAGATGD